MLINKVILHLFGYNRAVVAGFVILLIYAVEGDGSFFCEATPAWSALGLKRLVAERFPPVNLEKILQWVTWEIMWDWLKKRNIKMDILENVTQPTLSLWLGFCD